MPPSHDELWGRALELLPTLKERAARCEELRRLPDDTLRDFHDAELFRLQQPKRVGGAELEFTTVVTFGALLARACASTAWNWVNFAAHHMMLGMFPPRAQDEIWGRSPDALIASSFVFPAAKARKVKDGYVITRALAVLERRRSERMEHARGARLARRKRAARAARFHAAALAVQGHRHLVRRRACAAPAARTSRRASSSCRST